MSNITRSTVRT